jgi:mRNA interferase HigB
MHLVTRQKLKQFWQKYPDAEGVLTAWAKEVEHARWKTPNDIKARYRSADPIGDNRVVFNIKGNSYRVIVKIHYNTQVVYIRFVGTHAEYNKIDAEKI